MKRYCTNCRKDFDFPIKSMKDLDNLVCPECGSLIDKNSRNPAEDTSAQTEKLENAIGNTFSVFIWINYIFFVAISIFAIVAYNRHWDKALYIATGISLGVFVIQLFFHSLSFRTGLFFLPVGAAAGYLILHTIQGACLGIAIVFIARHLIRALFYRLLGRVISSVSG
ncbi:MAG: zinc ribbon domain-containing protein [Treponema sp.]|nr:zinc ribbon domain-containing protein [Treponema sp.]